MTKEIEELEKRIMERLEKLEARLADDLDDIIGQLGAIQVGIR